MPQDIDETIEKKIIRTVKNYGWEMIGGIRYSPKTVFKIAYYEILISPPNANWYYRAVGESLTELHEIVAWYIKNYLKSKIKTPHQ